MAWLPGVLIALVVAGCGAKREAINETIPPLPAVPIQVQTVENKSRMMTEEVLGTVTAKLQATLEARVNGHINQMPVALGEKVQKGQLIARLEAGEIEARLEQAKASQDEADRDWKRVSALFAQQSVTRAEYDAAQARQRRAQSAVAEASSLMSYVDLTAPFDGIITKKWADVGDLATPGKPLAAMEDPSALQMLADVPEALIANVSLGDHLPIHLATITNDILGTIAEISPVADPKSRTSLVKLDLPDEPGLRSGQFGRVAVPLGTASAIWVPTAAVIQRGQMELVFVLAGGQAQLRLVKTGNRIGDEIELVSGLNAGEQIVTAGAAVLTDGQPVTLQP